MSDVTPPADGPVLGEPPITIRAYHDSGPQTQPVSRWVVHDEEFPVGVNSGEDIANFFAGSGSGGSAHYVFDGDGEEYCVPEGVIAWHAPPNNGSLGGEHDGYAHFTRSDWLQPGSLATLHWSARRAADLCLRYKLPVVKLNAQDLLNGKAGICGHADVTAAWGQSDHTDPGPDFPWDVYLGLIHARMSPPNQWKVHPQFDPPLQLEPIVSAAPSPIGAVLAAADGSIYCFGTPFYGSANGQSYFAGRKVAEVRVDASLPGFPYVIRDTANEYYDFGFKTSAPRWTDYHPPVNWPLAPIRCMGSTPGGAVLVGDDGGVYCFGVAQFHGTPHGQSYWGNRTPAEVKVASNFPQRPYTIKAAQDGAFYDYGYDVGQAPPRW